MKLLRQQCARACCLEKISIRMRRGSFSKQRAGKREDVYLVSLITTGKCFAKLRITGREILYGTYL
jgi:hypothetical protein